MRLDGRCAFVTGSSRSIGAAIAHKLSQAGAKVILHARADRDACAAVAQSIRNAGGIADMLIGDLADGDAAGRIVEEAFAIHGALDILVLNAGGGKGGMAVDQTPATITPIIGLNLMATIHGAIAFARLTQSEHGRIIFISSGMATHGAPGVSIGAAAKAGSEGFIRAIAQELGVRGITCNTVAPGCTRTDMIASQSWPDQVPPWTALRRLGEPADIADIVAFLASDEARWLTGVTLPANGGLITTAANILARAKAPV